MKGYRRKSYTRFHMEPNPLKELHVGGLTGVHHAPAIPYIVLAITAATAAYTVYSTEQAASERKKIAAANAARIKAENEEALRRLKKQQESTMAEARARAAASGMTTEGTQKTYLEEMAEAFKSETDWLRESGASQAFITQREGTLAAQSMSAQGLTSAAGTVSGGLQYYGANA